MLTDLLSKVLDTLFDILRKKLDRRFETESIGEALVKIFMRLDNIANDIEILRSDYALRSLSPKEFVNQEFDRVPFSFSSLWGADESLSPAEKYAINKYLRDMVELCDSFRKLSLDVIAVFEPKLISAFSGVFITKVGPTFIIESNTKSAIERKKAVRYVPLLESIESLNVRAILQYVDADARGMNRLRGAKKELIMDIRRYASENLAAIRTAQQNIREFITTHWKIKDFE